MTAEDWKARVRTLLRDGYGVKDIAVKLNCDVAQVRRFVAHLRADGTLCREMGLPV